LNQDSERVVVSRDPWERQVAIRYGVLRDDHWWIASPVNFMPSVPGMMSGKARTPPPSVVPLRARHSQSRW
jgi:hypothetical protein